MDRLQIILVVFLGGVPCSSYGITGTTGSVLDVKVSSGDNVTLYCDCRIADGVYITWYRNCSHENQPFLVLNVKPDNWLDPWLLPRFTFLRNASNDSYDLSITNITSSDEGFYYCGTKESKKEDKDYLIEKMIYRYSNKVTRITVNSPELRPDIKTNLKECGSCWTLLFSLCPAVLVLSALLSSLLVHRLCQKTGAKKHQDDEKQCHIRSQTRQTQGEDVCYAALEIPEASLRPNRKRTMQSSDSRIYSAINASAP